MSFSRRLGCPDPLFVLTVLSEDFLSRNPVWAKLNIWQQISMLYNSCKSKIYILGLGDANNIYLSTKKLTRTFSYRSVLGTVCVYVCRNNFDLWHNVENEDNDSQQGVPGVYQDFLSLCYGAYNHNSTQMEISWNEAVNCAQPI